MSIGSLLIQGVKQTVSGWYNHARGRPAPGEVWSDQLEFLTIGGGMDFQKAFQLIKSCDHDRERVVFAYLNQNRRSLDRDVVAAVLRSPIEKDLGAATYVLAHARLEPLQPEHRYYPEKGMHVIGGSRSILED